MLKPCIVNLNMYCSKFLSSLLDYFFGFIRLTNIGVNEFGFDIIFSDKGLYLLDFFFLCESIENNIGTSARQLFGETKSDSTQGPVDYSFFTD